MARTTVSKVRDIFSTDLSDNQITSWIDIANEIVNDVEAADSSITDSRLSKLEKLVTAHLASGQDQRIQSGERESASIEYQGRTGFDFRGTKYGQNAIALDPTGTLLESSVKRDSSRYVSSTGDSNG